MTLHTVMLLSGTVTPEVASRITNPSDFALVAMLGLLGLRIFEAAGADIGDLSEEHGHRVLLRVREEHQGGP